MAETATFDHWGIVEVMGHKRYAGHITEQVIGGSALIRVDVPETKSGEVTHAPFTKLIGAGSIYMITPTTEEVARRAANAIAHYVEVLPVTLPAERQIPATVVAREERDPDFDIEEGDGDWGPEEPG